MNQQNNEPKKARRYLQCLEFDNCYKEVEKLLAQNSRQQDPYCIGIRAAELSDDPVKLLNLVERGFQQIQDDRVLFLKTSYEACKKMGYLKHCGEIANDLKEIGENTNQIDLLFYEADVFISNNKPELAEKIYNELIQRFPKNLNCWLKAIDSKRIRRDWEGAIEAAKKANDLFPNSWRSYDNLAEEYLRAGKVEDAKRLYSIGIADKQTPKDSTKQQFTALAALQYYSPNDKQTQDQAVHPEIELINQKIKLQWSSSLGEDGTYQLVGFEQSSAIIEQVLGNREVDLFQKCALPAMQADVIRVVHLATKEHAIYIDWPHRPFQRGNLLSQKLFESEQSLLAGKRKTQEWELWNGFAYSNPNYCLKGFFSEILEEIFYNIKHETSNNVAAVTGPGVWRNAYKRHGTYLEEEKIQRTRFPFDIKQVFLPALNKRPSMKGHWSTVQKTQSIFKQADQLTI